MNRFEYVRPNTLQEALSHLNEDENTRIVLADLGA